MKSLRDIHEKVEQRVDEMRLLVSIHAHEYILLNRFISELKRDSGYMGTCTGLGFEDGTMKGVYVQFHLMKKESFQSAAPLIEYLLDRGWKQDSQTEDASWGYRQVSFRKPAEQPLFWPVQKEWKPRLLTATVRLWPHPESQICVKVEDGVETKYKYVCKGGAS